MHAHTFTYVSMYTHTRKIPASIFVRMVLVHFRNTSSTFSPVRALVSMKESSVTHNTQKHSMTRNT